MARTKLMPDDIRRECLSIVAGYNRRLREYYTKRREIMDHSPQRFVEVGDEWVYPPSSHDAARTAENIALALEALERQYETKKMRAVEYARQRIGADLPDSDLKRRLVDAIMLNCRSGRKFPYACFDLTGIEKTNFYDRRGDFLTDIAKFLGMM